MKAVDTNVLVRIIAQDDPAQTSAAQAVVDEGVVVSSGVWIETEGVLRSIYRMPREHIAEALASVLAKDGIETADDGGIAWAIERYAAGADWADMVHVVDARRLSAFITFDRSVSKHAGATSPVLIELIQ